MDHYFFAILNPDTLFLRALLTLDSSCINTPDPKKKRTLLGFVASLDNKIEMMKVLLDMGATVDTTDLDGRTALSYALQRNKDEAVKVLLQNGADPLLEDSLGKIPLQYAEPGSECLRILLAAITRIVHDDHAEESRRNAAARIINGVCKSTVSEIEQMMAFEMKEIERLRAVGAPIPCSFFSSSSEGYKEEYAAAFRSVQDSHAYGKILSNYRRLRIPASRAAEYEGIKPMIEKGSLLNDLSRDNLLKVSLETTDPFDSINPLLEMAILAKFLTYVISDPDVDTAFTKTSEQFEKQINDMSPESKVRSFFIEYGLIRAAAPSLG